MVQHQASATVMSQRYGTRTCPIHDRQQDVHERGCLREENEESESQADLRAVPAIVTLEVWEAAQEVLRSNRITCRRNENRPYLLRGLIIRGLCG